MALKQKSLTYPQITGSQQIQTWLTQFDSQSQPVAIEMLCRLKFISRDTYAGWLKSALDQFAGDSIALFGVRKFNLQTQCVWDQNGMTRLRPAESQGSEDLVQSVIANYVKDHSNKVFDHPGIKTIRENRIRRIVLLDDSMGSGKRVAGFIERMMNHKSFLSWWSYGKIRIEVLSFSRTLESEHAVRDSLVGSEHHARSFPAHTKIHFRGHVAYKRSNYAQRWGHGYLRILDLCDSAKKIRRDRRRGFGETMANTVFYHSVPNNIPGVLWFDSPEWNALLPRRKFPAWLDKLLDGKPLDLQRGETTTDIRPENELVIILTAVRRGVRNEHSIAWSIGLDRKVVADLMLTLRGRGLLTIKNRLTSAGRTFLRRHENQNRDSSSEFGLYVPKSWCAGRQTVQPTGLNRASGQVQSESEAGSPAEDGETGQVSLERTDAKTASPSLSVMTQDPSTPRERHDRHGPFGSRET